MSPRRTLRRLRTRRCVALGETSQEVEIGSKKGALLTRAYEARGIPGRMEVVVHGDIHRVLPRGRYSHIRNPAVAVIAGAGHIVTRLELIERIGDRGARHARMLRQH